MPLKNLKSALMRGDGILSDMDMSKLPETPEWVTQRLEQFKEREAKRQAREARKAARK